MRYSIEPRDRVYVKGYGFMSFARSMSNKYGKKLVDTAKKSAADAIKTASKRAIQKTAEGPGDLLIEARNEPIKFYDDYSLIMSEAKSKAKQNETEGTGFKILTPKQML